MPFSKPLLALLSVGVLCCVALAALQTFVFAPFAVQFWTVDYLKILGLFGIEVGIAVLSLRDLKGAALAAVFMQPLFRGCGGTSFAEATSPIVTLCGSSCPFSCLPLALHYGPPLSA